MQTCAASSVKHSTLEDAIALVVGTLLISTGVYLFSHDSLLTGGTAGLSFLLHYLTGLPFGYLFFALNLPFYYLAFKRMGKAFTIKTLIAVSLLSGFTLIHPMVLTLGESWKVYSAVIGAVIMAMGFIVLFRHKASLGGFNILALYLQEKYGIRAGRFLMVTDFLIVLSSLSVVSMYSFCASIVGILVLNQIITMNHRTDRYLSQ